MAQLRAGILPLHLETGRYVNTPVHERICLCCNQEAVEDEFHFIFDCTLYSNLRHNFFISIVPDITHYDRLTTLKTLFQSFPRKFANYLLFFFQLSEDLLLCFV